jgi:hypothetical protein
MFVSNGRLPPNRPRTSVCALPVCAFVVVLGHGVGALGTCCPSSAWDQRAHRQRPPVDFVGFLLLALNDQALKGPVNGTAPNPSTNADFTHTLGDSSNPRVRIAADGWRDGASYHRRPAL